MSAMTITVKPPFSRSSHIPDRNHENPGFGVGCRFIIFAKLPLCCFSSNRSRVQVVENTRNAAAPAGAPAPLS